VTEDGSFVEASNAAFDATFLAAEDFFDDVIRYKTTSSLLFPRYGARRGLLSFEWALGWLVGWLVG
jgi:hypothetical protein